LRLLQEREDSSFSEEKEAKRLLFLVRCLEACKPIEHYLARKLIVAKALFKGRQM
jgi:hypothetical protein